MAPQRAPQVERSKRRISEPLCLKRVAGTHSRCAGHTPPAAPARMRDLVLYAPASYCLSTLHDEGG